MGKAYFLLVDDDTLLIDAYERMVARYFLSTDRNIEIILAHSGEDALDKVESKLAANPDAEWGLLTDYDMPGMSGVMLAATLDDKLGSKLVWRLIVSGIVNDERKAEIDALCAFGEQKPFDRQTLESYLYIFMTSLS